MTTPQPHRRPGPDSAGVPPHPLARSPAEIPAPPPRHATPHYLQPLHYPRYPPPPQHGQRLQYSQPPEHFGHPQRGADLPPDDGQPGSELPGSELPGSELDGRQGEGEARPLAGFPARAISFLIDTVAPCSVLIAVLIFVGSVVGDPLMILAVSAFGSLWLFAFVLWNSCYQQGVTGQSIGRRVAKTTLVHIETGAPVGFGTALLRQICHGVEFGIGYLWPLWDERRQTFADKIVGTLVVHVEGRTEHRPPAQRRPSDP